MSQLLLLKCFLCAISNKKWGFNVFVKHQILFYSASQLLWKQSDFHTHFDPLTIVQCSSEKPLTLWTLKIIHKIIHMNQNSEFKKHYFNNQSHFTITLPIMTHHRDQPRICSSVSLFTFPLDVVTPNGWVFRTIINNCGCHSMKGEELTECNTECHKYFSLSSVMSLLDLIKSLKQAQVSHSVWAEYYIQQQHNTYLKRRYN